MPAKRTAPADKVVWLDQGWLPISIGFVPSEKAWDEVMKSMKCDAPWPERSTANANAQLFEEESGSCVILISVFDRPERSASEIIGTFIHEAVHVWQFICRQIGEDAPGLEMEAYGIQRIAEQLIGTYLLTLGGGKQIGLVD